MKLLIFEDNPEHQGRLETALLQIARQLRVKLDISLVQTYEDLQEMCQQFGEFQIYFLDLEVDGDHQLGFKVAQEIRRHDPYSSIVFVSSYSESLPLSFHYHVSALDFIEKELPQSDFEERLQVVLDYVIQQNSLDEERELWHYSYEGRRSISIPYRDILAIETTGDSHKLKVYCTNSTKIFYGTLADIVQKDTEGRFAYGSRYLLLYLDNIQDCQKGEVTFLNGLSFPVSRGRMRALKKKLN